MKHITTGHDWLGTPAGERRSRGYVAVERELLEAQISPDALGLALRIRAHTDEREQDGYVAIGAVRALCLDWGWGAARLRRVLAALIEVDLLAPQDGGYLDLGHRLWGTPRRERQRRREADRARVARHRARSADAGTAAGRLAVVRSAADGEGEIDSPGDQQMF